MRLSFFSELQNPSKSHITTYLSQRLKSIGFFIILKEGTTKGSEGKKYFQKTILPFLAHYVKMKYYLADGFEI